MSYAKRIAVIGASGFLGREVVKQLRATGHVVTPVDRQPHPAEEKTHLARIEDYAEVAAVLERSRPEAVINLAYLVGQTAETDVRAASLINLTGQANVLQACVDNHVPRYIYASSIAVYGPSQSFWGQTRPLDETVTCPLEHHRTSYGATKTMNEFQARLVSDQTELETCGIRLSIVLGPGRERGLTTWTSETIQAAHAGHEDIEVPVRASQRVNLISLEDSARCMTNAATLQTSLNRIYNSGGHDLSAQEMCSVLAKRYRSARFTFSPDADSTPFVNHVDASLITEDMAFAPGSIEGTLLPR